jgi:hypothetical protein
MNTLSASASWCQIDHFQALQPCIANNIIRPRPRRDAFSGPAALPDGGNDQRFSWRSTLIQDSFDTELALLCQSTVSKDEFDFFLRLANGTTTFREESERLQIKLPACYKRFERIRDKLQRAVGRYYKF